MIKSMNCKTFLAHIFNFTAYGDKTLLWVIYGKYGTMGGASPKLNTAWGEVKSCIWHKTHQEYLWLSL